MSRIQFSQRQRLWFGLSSVVVACVLVVVGASYALKAIAENKEVPWCAPDAPRHAPHAMTGETCPVVGRMGKVKLAVPQHYLLGPFVYKGVDIWNAESFKNSPKQPTFETEIDNFAIKIRQTNFKPIETQQDWADYDKLGKSLYPQPPENRWIHVGFESATYRLKSPVGWTNSYRSGELFVKQKEKMWDLDHYLTPTPPSADINGHQQEIFFDSKTNNTRIRCDNRLQHAPPYKLLTSCELEFISPDGQTLINADSIDVKTDLAHWREIQQGVLAVYQSFIVP